MRFPAALAVVFLCTSCPTAFAEPVGPRLPPAPPLPQQSIDLSQFPRPPSLLPAIDFWTHVFSNYSEHQLLLHAQDFPHKVITVLDYREQAAAGANPVQLRRQLLRDERAAKEKIDALLKAVHLKRSDPARMNAEERSLFELFADIKDPLIYQKLVGRVRGQRGLKERTALAMTRAGAYMQEFERIFAERRLPLALTRLPIVESSFNVEAYSKVGAAGLWQFIPSSARQYMVLDDLRDERSDPWAATHAAARHLQADFDVLQSWPLAVTAYNYGRTGLRRALQQVNGSSLVDLIDRYDNPRFGFASRNFYAEFLAAVDVERDAVLHFGPIKPEPPLKFEQVELTDFVAYSTVQELSGANLEHFHRLNPSWRSEVREDKLYLSPGASLRVPPGQAQAFKLAYEKLPAGQRHSRQREYWRSHKVRRGESLITIAKHYRIPLRDIQRANAIQNPHFIKIGQRLKIPPPADAMLSQAGPKVHKVRSGQTLWDIARAHSVSLEALLAHNQLDKSQLLHVGTRLQIP